MRLQIKHTTRYHYAIAPSFGLLQVRVTPHSSAMQTVHAWETELEGARQQARFTDQHGNLVDLIEIISDTQTIDLTVSGEVETLNSDGIFGQDEHAMQLWLYQRQTELTKPNRDIDKLAKLVDPSSSDAISDLHALSQTIREQVEYQPGETGVATTAVDALKAGKGVCQDHSHIFLSAARKSGFPARYVSGYLLMDDQTAQDASHAWAEVYLNGLGWVGFDISNGISPDERYVRIAQGSDYADAAPTRGLTRGAGPENMIVSIQVQQ